MLPSVQIQAKQKRKITFSFRQIYFCDNDDFHVLQCHVIVIVQKQTHILQIFKERCLNVDHGAKYFTSKRKSSKGINNFNDKSIQILQMTAFDFKISRERRWQRSNEGWPQSDIASITPLPALSRARTPHTDNAPVCGTAALGCTLMLCTWLASS